jgi:transposase InsO family protein
MAGRMTAGPVCDAPKMAVFRRKRPEGVIAHPDRGGQHGPGARRRVPGLRQSRGGMGARGSCHGNARAGGFFHPPKAGAIPGGRFDSREAMRQAVFE